jgi:lipopolysaccharide/colanic/teichoic acid biosynthesis glycosyltransferase
MFQDAEKNGAQWAKHRDGRITRLGRFLRKTRLDEAPQFWNIVKGDMSLVGPRPERPEFVDQLRHRIPFFVQRHLVKPGLTGWAQINYPYGASIEDTRNKLKYDLFYIKRASVGLDAQIILRTIGAMMKGSR